MMTLCLFMFRIYPNGFVRRKYESRFIHRSVRHIAVDAEIKTLSGRKQLIIMSVWRKRAYLSIPNIPISMSEMHKLRMKMSVELFPPVVNFDAARTTKFTTTTSPAKMKSPIRKF